MVEQEYIKRRVENIVCDVVSSSYYVIMGKRCEISPCNLYDVAGKCTSAVSICRQFVFLLLHDRFGISYRRLSVMTGMRVTSIMRCARKARSLKLIDSIYNTISQILENALQEELL